MRTEATKVACENAVRILFLTNVKPTYKSKFLNRHKGRFLLRFLTCVKWAFLFFRKCG